MRQMNNYRPLGHSVTFLDGVERHFLFTLAVVSEIQGHYDLPVGTVMAKLADDREGFDTLAYLALTLANDEIMRRNDQTGKDDPLLTEKQVKWLIDVPLAKKILKPIMMAYGYSMPENEEDDDPN